MTKGRRHLHAEIKPIVKYTALIYQSLTDRPVLCSCCHCPQHAHSSASGLVRVRPLSAVGGEMNWRRLGDHQGQNWHGIILISSTFDHCHNDTFDSVYILHNHKCRYRDIVGGINRWSNTMMSFVQSSCYVSGYVWNCIRYHLYQGRIKGCWI